MSDVRTRQIARAEVDKTIARLSPPGKVFYVGQRTIVRSAGVTGLDADGYGKAPQKPYKTVDYAIGQCVSNHGDVIYVLPKHAETISSATEFLADKGGISIICLGRGNNRPLFTIDGTAGGFVVTSADVYLENATFKASTSAIVRMAHIKGKYCHMKDCEILDGGNSHVLVGAEVGAANNDADGFTMEGCFFTQLDAASVNGLVFMKDQVDCRILGNYIQGDFAVGGIVGMIAADAAENLTRILVKENMLISAASDQAIAINLDGPANTGMLIGNYAAAPDADWTPFIAAGCSFHQNFGSGALASSGYLYPAADS